MFGYSFHFGKYLIGEVFLFFFDVGISCSGRVPCIQFPRVFFAQGMCGMCDVSPCFNPYCLYFLYVCVFIGVYFPAVRRSAQVVRCCQFAEP